MNPATISAQRLTKIQNKLFEHAHSEALELKPIGIKFSRRGILPDKLCLHPRLIALPIGSGAGLESLSTQEINLISIALYGLIYRNVACGEDTTLISNMYVAEKVFDRYSDEYMVLYQETTEEYDHIWSFRTIYQAICRDLNYSGQFSTNSFFEQELGHSPRNQWRARKYQFLQFMTGEGLKLMSPSLVRKSGAGALWLLYRYLANVQLKQTEAYLFAEPEKYNYDPLARELTESHANDEARHYTTSLDMGLALYQDANPIARQWVKSMITMTVESHIHNFYLKYWEMLDLYLKGINLSCVKYGLEALAMVRNHPEFTHKQILDNVDDLIRIWHSEKLGDNLGDKTNLGGKRWRYTAQQLQRLIDALELKLNRDSLGVTYDRFVDALS